MNEEAVAAFELAMLCMEHAKSNPLKAMDWMRHLVEEEGYLAKNGLESNVVFLASRIVLGQGTAH